MHTLLGTTIVLIVGLFVIGGLIVGLAALTPKRTFRSTPPSPMPKVYEGDMLQEVKRRNLVAHLEKARQYEQTHRGRVSLTDHRSISLN